MSDIFRNLTKAALDSATWIAQNDASRNAAFGYNLGRLAINAGSSTANSLVCTLLHPQGFTALQDGAMMWLTPLANNTSAVEIDIEGIGPVALRDGDGVALAADVLVAGRSVLVGYDDDNSYLRILGAATAALSGSAIPPYVNLEILTASDTWEAPFDLYARIWLCAGGGSGGQVRSSSTNPTCSGAGGGEMAVKYDFAMEQGQQLDFTRGDGGPAGSTISNDDGNAGGNSSVTGPSDLSITVNGGGPGLSGIEAALAGGDGGDGGTGGDKHWPGQDGAATSASSGQQAGCGGCPGIVDAPSAPATDTQTAQELLNQIGSLAGIYNWMARGRFLSGAGVANTTAGGVTGPSPSPGCGSGGVSVRAASGSVVAAPGGNGFMAIEYTAAIS